MEGEESVSEGIFEGVGELRFMALESGKGFFVANMGSFGGGWSLWAVCSKRSAAALMP